MFSPSAFGCTVRDQGSGIRDQFSRQRLATSERHTRQASPKGQEFESSGRLAMQQFDGDFGFRTNARQRLPAIFAELIPDP
jgi:hypothetical protein